MTCTQNQSIESVVEAYRQDLRVSSRFIDTSVVHLGLRLGGPTGQYLLNDYDIGDEVVNSLDPDETFKQLWLTDGNFVASRPHPEDGDDGVDDGLGPRIGCPTFVICTNGVTIHDIKVDKSCDPDALRSALEQLAVWFTSNDNHVDEGKPQSAQT